MIILGVWLASVFATVVVQGLALGSVAFLATRFGASASLRQILWRGTILMPPIITAALLLSQRVVDPVETGAPIASLGGRLDLAPAGMNLAAASQISVILPIAGWACLVFAVLWTVRTALAYRRVTRTVRLATVCSEVSVLSEAQRLAGAAGARRPQVRVASDVGPFATGTRTIVLPQWALALPAGQRTAVIAHEIRHLGRADPVWLGIVSWLSGVTLNPFGRAAARNLSAIAEDDCDGWATRREGGAQDLAEALLACAMVRTSNMSLVPMMATENGSLGRVRRLIQGEARELARMGGSRMLAVGVLMSLCCATVPAMSFVGLPVATMSTFVVAAEERGSRSAPDDDAVSPRSVLSAKATGHRQHSRRAAVSRDGRSVSEIPLLPREARRVSPSLEPLSPIAALQPRRSDTLAPLAALQP